MKKLYEDITGTIGDTPMVKLPIRNPNWELFLKIEKTNPGQSMKDRMALSMINNAVESGLLLPGGTIIESSSGNTATGLALISAARGYRFIAVVDHHAAREKIDTIKAYGGEIVYVGEGVPSNVVAVKEREETALRLSREIPNSLFLNQADNPANPQGYQGLASEIAEQLDNVKILIGSIGTGGSLCGTARGLKAFYPTLEVHAVEPLGSVVFGGKDAPYYQSGTGNPGSVEIADNVDYTLISSNYYSTDREAFNTARFLARNKGILIGGSSGGVIYRALENLDSIGGSGKAVAIIADGGEKYINTIFNDEWMRSKDLLDINIDTRLKILLNLTQ
jgi:cystathionine beta-synthase